MSIQTACSADPLVQHCRIIMLWCCFIVLKSAHFGCFGRISALCATRSAPRLASPRLEDIEDLVGNLCTQFGTCSNEQPARLDHSSLPLRLFDLSGSVSRQESRWRRQNTEPLLALGSATGASLGLCLRRLRSPLIGPTGQKLPSKW